MVYLCTSTTFVLTEQSLKIVGLAFSVRVFLEGRAPVLVPVVRAVRQDAAQPAVVGAHRVHICEAKREPLAPARNMHSSQQHLFFRVKVCNTCEQIYFVRKFIGLHVGNVCRNGTPRKLNDTSIALVFATISQSIHLKQTSS